MLFDGWGTNLGGNQEAFAAHSVLSQKTTTTTTTTTKKSDEVRCRALLVVKEAQTGSSSSIRCAYGQQHERERSSPLR